MNTIKVAIADDHKLFRSGLISLLDTTENIRVVLEVGTGKELAEQMTGMVIDVVLMDVEMPEMDGIEASRLLRKTSPQTKIVMLSAHNEKGLILHAIENGACGYLLKDTDRDELIDAINTVMQNGFCFNKDISNLLLKGIVDKEQIQTTFSNKPQLTERELKILELVCKELTNVEISEKLFLSPRTVEGHRQRMIEKIGARNTVGLVLFALKNKLVEI
jgi:DNA-binding NarL/FixJ family response regulator